MIVMDLDVGEYLRAKSLDPLSRGDGQWLIRCLFCGDSKNQRHRHLYVNKEHGAFKCQRCNEDGGFNKLRESLGDPPIRKDSEAKWPKEVVWETAVSLAADRLFDNLDVVKYLNDRGIANESIVEFQIGFMDKEWVTSMRDKFDLRSMREAGLVQEWGNEFWSYQAILIPYLEGGKVTQLRAKHIGGNTIGLRDVPTRLFNTDATADAKNVVVCEGEMDAILLHQKGYNVVGVPGAGAFKDIWLRYFDGVRRVYIVPDHDRLNEVTGERAGIEGAKRTKRLIGERATIVELPRPDDDEPTDLTDYFIRDNHSNAEFSGLIADHTDSRLSTFDVAYEEYVDLLSANGIETGFKDLDRYMFPGMLPGQVCIVLAKTGVGKTTFATQLIWNFVDGGESVMMLSLEQMKGEIASRLYKIARYSDTTREPASIGMSLNALFRLNDENRMPPDDLPMLIDDFEEQVGERPKVLIVDYLGYWARSFKGGSAYEQTTAAIMELKNIAKREKLVIVTPHQVNRVGNRGEKLTLDMARDSGAIEETGDFVMSLYAPSHRDTADVGQMTYKDRAELKLDLLKSRHGNVNKTVSMYFAPMSLAVRPATMMEQPRIQKEWAAFDRSLTYPEFDRERRAKAV